MNRNSEKPGLNLSQCAGDSRAGSLCPRALPGVGLIPAPTETQHLEGELTLESKGGFSWSYLFY